MAALLPSGHGYFPHLTRASSSTIIPSRASNSGLLQAGLLVKRGYGVATLGKAKLDISPPSPEFFFQVWCGGGPRPRKPRVWRTKQRKGTVSKSQKLLDHIKGLSNVKEEVYGALDTFIAWELEFPLVTVKKALTTLKHEGDWQRVIQISKWMLSKGQGRTFGSYLLLLEAFDITNRDEEAEELWQSIFLKHLEVTPRIMFSTMISFYYKRDKFDELLELFASMEELQVRPDQSTVDIVAQVYEKLGSPDKAEKARNKYPPPKWEYRYNKGKRIRVRTFPDVQVNNAHSDGKISDEHYSEEGRDFQENEYGTESRIQSGDVEEESIFTEDNDSFITEGVCGRRNSDEKHYSLENSDFGEEIRIKNSVDETNISTEDDPNRTVLVDDLSKQNQPKMSASTSYSSRSAFVNL